MEKQGDKWVTMQQGLGKPENDQLVTIYENGDLLVEYTLDQVRAAAEVTEHEPTGDSYPDGEWATEEGWAKWAREHLRCVHAGCHGRWIPRFWPLCLLLDQPFPPSLISAPLPCVGPGRGPLCRQRSRTTEL